MQCALCQRKFQWTVYRIETFSGNSAFYVIKNIKCHALYVWSMINDQFRQVNCSTIWMRTDSPTLYSLLTTIMTRIFFISFVPLYFPHTMSNANESKVTELNCIHQPFSKYVWLLLCLQCLKVRKWITNNSIPSLYYYDTKYRNTETTKRGISWNEMKKKHGDDKCKWDLKQKWTIPSFQSSIVVIIIVHNRVKYVSSGIWW